MLLNETLVSLHYCRCDFSIDRLPLPLCQGLETAVCLSCSTTTAAKASRTVLSDGKNKNEKKIVKSFFGGDVIKESSMTLTWL